MAVDAVHLVLAEEELDPLRVLGDDLVLVGVDANHVDADVLGVDADLLAVQRLVVDLGRVEQRLGGDAAAQEAGAAEAVVLLDDDDLHSKLSGADGGDIAAGAGADDREVVQGHEVLQKSVTAASSRG